MRARVGRAAAALGRSLARRRAPQRSVSGPAVGMENRGAAATRKGNLFPATTRPAVRARGAAHRRHAAGPGHAWPLCPDARARAPQTMRATATRGMVLAWDLVFAALAEPDAGEDDDGS